jgi:hypothetical protein
MLAHLQYCRRLDSSHRSPFYRRLRLDLFHILRGSLPYTMTTSSESTSSPSPPNVPLRRQFEKGNPEDSPVMPAPDSRTATKKPSELDDATTAAISETESAPSPHPHLEVALGDQFEKANPDASPVMSASESQTVPFSASGKTSESDDTSKVANNDPDISQTSLSQSRPHNEMTFTLFPKLPLELRRMVWSCALPRLHVVELRSRQVIPREVESILLMAVCQESRRIALESYKAHQLGTVHSSRSFLLFR